MGFNSTLTNFKERNVGELLTKVENDIAAYQQAQAGGGHAAASAVAAPPPHSAPSGVPVVYQMHSLDASQKHPDVPTKSAWKCTKAERYASNRSMFFPNVWVQIEFVPLPLLL